MNNKKFPLVLLLAFLVSGPATLAEVLESADPGDHGFDESRLEKLDDVLESYVENEELAGAVALIARNGKVVYLGAVGERDRENGEAMTDDTIFRIASQTKAIVSTAALMLQEEGKLLISDPVGKYLPEYMETTVAVADEDGGYDIVPAERPITIRDLLTHTSGFDYGYGVAVDRWEAAGIQGWYFADRDEPIRETIRRMAALPAVAQPGEAFVYGYSTDILGVVVEAASGLSLEAFLEERIFKPLDMDDTHFYLPESKRDRLATVYGLVEGQLARGPEDGNTGQGAYVDGPRKSFSGGAGLLSTAGDYARFLQMILNGGELDGERILSPKSVELMSANHLGDVDFRPGQGFGLGFSILEDLGARGSLGTVGELGWGGAYHSTYWIDPAEEIVVAYMTNLIPAGGVDEREKLRAILYSALIE